MKKIMYLAMISVAALSVSCRKEPSMHDGEYLVYTAHDENADFSKYTTFNIPDEILVIGESEKPEYVNDSRAKAIIGDYREQLEKAGFQYVADKAAADLGVQITYTVKSRYYSDIVSDPYWWVDYPGYWSPYYWGNWNGWYHSYVVTYRYSTNALMAEIADLTAAQDNDAKLPVLWSSFINGEVSSNQYFTMVKIEDAIEQAFSQSPYIRK